jgi:DNA-binding response OmpR family regulator
MDTSSKQILLIEDDMLIRELYSRQLILSGFQTDAFDNGIDGIAAAQKKHYDLILLDIMMPKMNGLDVLKVLKGDERTKNMPVLFLTNLGQDSILQEGAKLGTIGFLIKASYTPTEIIDRIKEILAKLSSQPSTP